MGGWRRRLLVTAPIAAVAPLVGFGLTLTSASAGTVDIPATVPQCGAGDATAALNGFLSSVPDGSTVEFPTHGCYDQSSTIRVVDRHNLTIHGNGASFSKRSPSVPCESSTNPGAPQWRLQGGSNVTMDNMVINGVYLPNTAPNGCPRRLV